MTENKVHSVKRPAQRVFNFGRYQILVRSALRSAPCSFDRGTQHLASRIPDSVSCNQHPASSRLHPASCIEYPVSSIQHPSPGFTLMEILLAVLILGIVVTTILASFNAVFSTTDTLDLSARYFDMAKSCLNRMMLDLEALYVSRPPFYKKPEFDAPPDPYRLVGAITDIGGTGFANLRFTSRAHIPFEKHVQGGIAEIVYYVLVKTDGQRVLKRRDNLYPYPPFEENGSDPVLCNHVKSLAFKYYDAEGTVSEEWDSDSAGSGYATPTAVAIQLEIGTESESHLFETMVRIPVHRDKIE